MISHIYNQVKNANDFTHLQPQKVHIFQFEQVSKQTGVLKFQTGVGS